MFLICYPHQEGGKKKKRKKDLHLISVFIKFKISVLQKIIKKPILIKSQGHRGKKHNSGTPGTSVHSSHRLFFLCITLGIAHIYEC